eukprot:sb/3475709/
MIMMLKCARNIHKMYNTAGIMYREHATERLQSRNRPNQDILVSDWLITSHNSLFRSRDWLSANQGPVYILIRSSDPDLVAFSGRRVLSTKSVSNILLISYIGGRLSFTVRNRPKQVNNQSELVI